MKKPITLTLLLLGLLSLILAGCAIQPPTPAAQPSEAATVTPAPDEGQLGGMNDLVGSWQWIGFSDPVNGPADIANPENYVVIFNDDGTVNIKADCNKASGSYTADDGLLNIEIGPMTRAACPEGSRGDDFVKYLGFAAAYEVDGDSLRIDLMADGGSMTFARVEATQLPVEGTEGQLGGMNDLVGSWQWMRFSDPVNGSSDIASPEKYVITFNEDGSVQVRADCNNAQGIFMVQDSSVKIELGPATTAYCGDDSRSDDFLKYLGFAAIYEVDGDNLRIDLMADGGTMTLAKVEAVQLPSEGTAPPSETAGDIVGEWKWTRFDDPVKGAIQIGAPLRYLIRFNEDGTVQVKAACNNAQGTYTLQEDGLRIELGPTTLVQCVKKNRGAAFLEYLAAAGAYQVEGDLLQIDLKADGGTMTFQRTDAVMSEEKPAPAPTKAAPSAPGQGVKDNGPRAHARGKFNPPHYTVAKGDTLFSIAERFNVTVDQLMAANNLSDKAIRGGMVLIIPGATANKPGRPPTAAHYQRVRFNGSASVQLNGVIKNGQPKGYIVAAKKGQVLEIHTESSAENLQIIVENARGKKLKVRGDNGQVENNVFVKIRANGDYIVIIRPTTPPENQELPFTILFVRQ